MSHSIIAWKAISKYNEKTTVPDVYYVCIDGIVVSGAFVSEKNAVNAGKHLVKDLWNKWHRVGSNPGFDPGATHEYSVIQVTPNITKKVMI